MPISHIQYVIPTQHHINVISDLLHVLDNTMSVCFPDAKPKVIEQPNDQATTMNGTATFSCKIAGKPTPEVTWHASGVTLEV